MKISVPGVLEGLQPRPRFLAIWPAAAIHIWRTRD